MTEADTNAFNSGRKYTFSKTLAEGTDYTYYFEARDVNNGTAIGSPTASVDAPDLSAL